MIELCIMGSGIGEEKRILQTRPLDAGLYQLGNTNAADLPLHYPTVSRSHAEISVVAPSTVTIRDLGSRNGTWLKKTALPRGEHSPWPEGLEVEIGPYLLIWRKKEPAPEKDERALLRSLTDLYAKKLTRTVNDESRLHLPEECLSELDPQQRLQPKQRAHLIKQVFQEFYDHGPITELIDDPQCREILVNRFDEIFYDRGNGIQKFDRNFVSAETYLAWIQRTAHDCGRRIDLQHPICDATLPNGARFHAVLEPISFGSPSVSIRKFGAAPINESKAIDTGWIEANALEILRWGVQKKKNIVVSGGTSTGKTSLLNFLCRWIGPNERVITIEDTVELSLTISDCVQLQARHANAEGIGSVPIRELLRCALRMRPDRIIVGECRGPEVLDMLQALNTGHPGSLTTVHANSPQQALQRLELLALLGASNLTAETLSRWLRHSIDWIVQVERSTDGRRFVDQILEINPEISKALYCRNGEA